MPTAAHPDAFFLPLGPADGRGDRYLATAHTEGPWDPRFQHGGPPSALLARAIERESPAWPATVVRVAVDILGPVPVGELELRSVVRRPGRSVDLVEAELCADGRPVVRAHGWRIRATELDLPVPASDDANDGAASDDGNDGAASYDATGPAAVPPLPEDESPLPTGWGGGYLHAVEWRVAAGGWGQPGAATIWGRMRYPLLPDEEPTGLQRVMAVADSGSGASNLLPMGSWLFINPELTVHLAAPPVGEWICLDAQTQLDPSGFGLASTRLFDRHRLVARGAQSLFVSPVGTA